MAATLLLIDDHTLFRAGLKAMLANHAGIGVMLEAESVESALAHAGTPVDLMLLDVQMPGLSGLDGVTLLRKRFADTPVLIVSGSCDSHAVNTARARGASGFVEKSASAADVFTAIDKVLSGFTAFPGRAAPSLGGDKSLTPRQLEVLVFLCKGYSIKLIARQLDLAENTVRIHVSAILNYLDVVSRAEAVALAHQRGIVS